MRIRESSFGVFTLTAENNKEYRILELLVADLRGKYGSPDQDRPEEGAGVLQPEDDPMVLLSDDDSHAVEIED